jgi:hypothetical protein
MILGGVPAADEAVPSVWLWLHPAVKSATTANRRLDAFDIRCIACVFMEAPKQQ